MAKPLTIDFAETKNKSGSRYVLTLSLLESF